MDRTPAPANTLPVDERGGVSIRRALIRFKTPAQKE
jgi:hypothetical protein